MNGRIASAAALAAASCALVAPPAQAQRATFQGIGHLPAGAESSALAVSADGRVVVGRAVGREGAAPVRWTSQTGVQALELAPGWGGAGWNWVATAASADSAAIAGYGQTPARDYVAFRWTVASGMVDLGDLPGGDVSAQARGISGDGSIVVGFSESGSGTASFPEAFRWTEAGGMETFLPFSSLTGATAISSDGMTIVGFYGCEGFHWTASGGMRLLDCEDSPSAVSSDGEVVVGWAGGGPGPFLWRRESGAYGSIPLLPDAWDAGAEAVSADGLVVVGWSQGPGGNGAFLWHEARATRDLRSVLEDDYGLDLTGWRFDGATGVSADGVVIVGAGTNPAGEPEGWIARLGNGPCYADCDASGVIDFFDFLCYQDSFAAAEPRADCDGSGQLDVFDFLCFQNMFAAGCP